MPRIPRSEIRARKFRESRSERADAKREATELAQQFSNLILAGRSEEAEELRTTAIPEATARALAVRLESQQVERRLSADEALREARTLVQVFNMDGQAWFRPSREVSSLVDSAFRKLDNLLRKGLTVDQALETLEERAAKAAIKAGSPHGPQEQNLLDLIWEKYSKDQIREKRTRRRRAA